MKKIIGISVATLAIVVVVMSIGRGIDPQPAQTSKIVPLGTNQRIGPAVNNSTTVPKGGVLLPQKTDLVVDPAGPNKTEPSSETQVSPIVSPIKETTSIDTGTQESLVKTSGLFNRRREKFWCEVNGNGTITYGTATWTCERHFLFFCTSGSWDYGVGLTMPGNANSCAGFLQGV